MPGWFSDTLKRIAQLKDWCEDLRRPKSTWLPALFNAMAFLTALMQVTGRNNSLALDNMTVETHCTIYPNVEKLADLVSIQAKERHANGAL